MEVEVGASLVAKKSIRELRGWEIIQLVRRIREDLSRLEVLALKHGKRGEKILKMYYSGKVSYDEAIRRLRG